MERVMKLKMLGLEEEDPEPQVKLKRITKTAEIAGRMKNILTALLISYLTSETIEREFWGRDGKLLESARWQLAWAA